MSSTLSAGLGLKPQHYDAALATSARGLWFEVHPENYMVDGGPRLAWLEAIRARHPLSLHGVGLSLAAPARPDATHLRRLRALVGRLQPGLVSEHLAWSRWDGVCLPDLLPVPRTGASLRYVVDNVACVQETLGRCIAIENPSHYLHFDRRVDPALRHAIDEVEFLAEVSQRTGCSLLLDLNNVFVSANNLGFDAERYVDAFPGDAISEVHLAGHGADPSLGAALLVDSHDAPVAEPVWRLYQRLIGRVGARPTLIERDDRLPGFDALLAERHRADALLRDVARATDRRTAHAAGPTPKPTGRSRAEAPRAA